MPTAAKFLITALGVLGIPAALSAQVTLERPLSRTTIAAAAPRVVESVAFEPATKQAQLGAALIRRDLIFVNMRWNHPDPSVSDKTIIAVSSSNWVPGPYSLRLEIPYLPVAARLTRYWYEGTARQEASCSLAMGASAACDLSFTVQSPSEAFWFEIRPIDPRNGFDAPMGRMILNRFFSF